MTHLIKTLKKYGCKRSELKVGETYVAPGPDGNRAVRVAGVLRASVLTDDGDQYAHWELVLPEKMAQFTKVMGW